MFTGDAEERRTVARRRQKLLRRVHHVDDVSDFSELLDLFTLSLRPIVVSIVLIYIYLVGTLS